MKLSVVVPVYNSEPYLRRCVDSILNQQFKDIEILLVDDESTDKSGSICNEYAEKHSNVSVFHIKNSGPATAKNVGYDNANGDFVAFTDSDDELEPEMFERMMECASHGNADIVCCSYIQINDDGTETPLKYTNQKYLFDRTEGLQRLVEKDLVFSQCWTKIYRKQLLDAWQIRFIDGLKTEEDYIYNLEVFLQANGVAVIDSPFYRYTHHAGSLQREYFKSHLDSYCRNMIRRIELVNMIGTKIHPKIYGACVFHAIHYYNQIIGRTAMFEYSLGKEYFCQAIKYIRCHPTILLSRRRACGFSAMGVLLLLILPQSLYFKYRAKRNLI